MTAKEARATLRDVGADLASVVEAAATIARDTNTSVEDLLKCLDRGGLAAETAAIELYRRTKRAVPASLRRLALGRREWEGFLARHINGSPSVRSVSRNGGAKSAAVNGARKHSRPMAIAGKSASRRSH